MTLNSSSKDPKAQPRAGAPPAISGTCANCAYHSGNMIKIPGVAQTFSSVCMYNPPVLVQGVPAQSDYPPVQPNWTCGRYA